MSELVKNQNKQNIRLGLLATTSAIAIAACVATVHQANAADRPTVWIESGWHLDSISGAAETLMPPLDGLTTAGFPSVPTGANFLGQGAGGFPSFTDMENILGRSSGAEGGISFQPIGSDWVFNISARYGRTHSRGHVQQRDAVVGNPGYVTDLLNPRHLATPSFTNYVEQAADNTEAHTIVDFKVGHDVGLGLFGERTESVVSLGARYFQMNMTSKGHSYAAPAVVFYNLKTSFGKYGNQVQYHKSATILQRYSDVRALGPTISWDTTTGLFGSPSNGQITVDWGVNAAVLFGRQKAKVNHSTIQEVHHGSYGAAFSSTGNSGHRTESHRVTIPNLGGFAALSYRFTNAKLSAGYRADFFFGAMDGGLDTHKSITTGFHGPFATIAVGLGG